MTEIVGDRDAPTAATPVREGDMIRLFIDRKHADGRIVQYKIERVLDSLDAARHSNRVERWVRRGMVDFFLNLEGVKPGEVCTIMKVELNDTKVSSW